MAEVAFDYPAIADRVKEAIRQGLGPDNVIVETNESYKGRIHLRVISPKLNGRATEERNQLLMDILHAELGADAQAVSLLMGYGTDDLF